MADATVTFEVDEELQQAFTAAARAQDRTVPQLLQNLMQDYVQEQHDQADYDAWFQHEVEKGLADMRAGKVFSSEEVELHFERRRSESRGKLGL